MNLNHEKLQSILSSQPLESVLQKLSKGGHSPHLVGGAVRDSLLLGRNPRDFDIVATGFDISTEVLEKLFPDSPIRETKMGGYQVEIDGVEFDMWNLEESWWFTKNNNIDKHSLSCMFEGTLLNIDAVSYNYEDEYVWMEPYFQDALKNKFIELNRRTHLDNRWWYDKIVSVAMRYYFEDWEFGPELTNYIKDYKNVYPSDTPIR